jgi:hypothetical protein
MPFEVGICDIPLHRAMAASFIAGAVPIDVMHGIGAYCRGPR